MLLNQDQIAHRLEAGEIFVDGSWDRGQLRGAAYDLRIEPRALVTSPGSGKVRHPTGPFTLDSGEIAVLTSREKCCLQWHIAANLVEKFSGVRDGLYVMHGGLVDPGFGLRWDAEYSEWVAAEDEGLIFLVTNIGGRPLVIDPASRSVLRVQFFLLAKGKVPEPEQVNLRAQNYREELEAQGGAEALGLQFFQDTRTLDNELNALRSRMTESIILVVFVLGVAAWGAVAAVLVALMSNVDLRNAAAAPSPALVSIGLLLVLGLYISIAVGLRRRFPRSFLR